MGDTRWVRWCGCAVVSWSIIQYYGRNVAEIQENQKHIAVFDGWSDHTEILEIITCWDVYLAGACDTYGHCWRDYNAVNF